MDNAYLINCKEQLLISSVVNDEYNADIIKKLFENLDIWSTNCYFLLLLAQFAKLHKWSYVDTDKKNWLNGILRQTQTRNAIVLSQTKKLLELFGTSVVLTCDLPIKLCYDPDTTRAIYTIKLLAEEPMLPKISKVLEQLNQNFPYDFSKIFVYSSSDALGLESVATTIYESTLGDICIPIPEDTLIMLFHYYVQKLKVAPDVNIAFKAYYDAAILLKECDLDRLDHRLENAFEKNTIQKYLNSAINFYHTIYV